MGRAEPGRPRCSIHRRSGGGIQTRMAERRAGREAGGAGLGESGSSLRTLPPPPAKRASDYAAREGAEGGDEDPFHDDWAFWAGPARASPDAYVTAAVAAAAVGYRPVSPSWPPTP